MFVFVNSKEFGNSFLLGLFVLRVAFFLFVVVFFVWLFFLRFFFNVIPVSLGVWDILIISGVMDASLCSSFSAVPGGPWLQIWGPVPVIPVRASGAQIWGKRPPQNSSSIAEDTAKDDTEHSLSMGISFFFLKRRQEVMDPFFLFHDKGKHVTCNIMFPTFESCKLYRITSWLPFIEIEVGFYRPVTAVDSEWTNTFSFECWSTYRPWRHPSRFRSVPCRCTRPVHTKGCRARNPRTLQAPDMKIIRKKNHIHNRAGAVRLSIYYRCGILPMSFFPSWTKQTGRIEKSNWGWHTSTKIIRCKLIRDLILFMDDLFLIFGFHENIVRPLR